MAIVKTINNEHEFAEWIKRSDSYKNNFSFDGANALQQYLEELSNDIGEDIEFDPIAWCCEFSEYKDFEEVKGDYWDLESMDDLLDKTDVIDFDGGLIIRSY